MNPFSLLQPKREITGISAVLLPFLETGEIDWENWEQHLARTISAGLIPAVNMDTGFVDKLSRKQRNHVLARANTIVGRSAWVAGAFVDAQPQVPFETEAYREVIDAIHDHEAIPIVFQSSGLTVGSDQQVLKRYEDLAEFCECFIAFELGSMFASFGKIYSENLFEAIIQIPQCVGLKHSSLDRPKEWQRLEIRNRVRPDFKLYTGNDLAIDMVMYGSDYLLGLSTMHPAAFAQRDAYWQAADPRFFALNDALQSLGWFSFRNPVPAYKHSAAMVFKLQGWSDSDFSPAVSQRPESDRATLHEILLSIESAMQE